MFSARWAHRFLVGTCILLAFCVGLYGVWVGWLGSGAQAWLQEQLAPLVGRLPSTELTDRIVRVLGATGTALTAAFGVYKGIYYADRNLPERLKQLLARADQRLQHDRQPLLAAIAERRHGVHARESVFYVEPLNRALCHLGFPDLQRADRSLVEALGQLQRQIEVSDCHRRNIDEQKAAAHILRGSIASTRAEQDARLGKSPDADRDLAEKEFTLALAIRDKDLDALELRGRQRELRGNDKDAFEDYVELFEAAKSAGDLLRAVRASKLEGQLLRGRGTRRDLDQAGRCLDAGLTLVNAGGSLTQAELFEKGLLLEAYGGVQEARKRMPSARKHLENAANCFGRVDTPLARNHADQAQLALARLAPPPSHHAPPQHNDEGVLKRLRKWLRRLFS